MPTPEFVVRLPALPDVPAASASVRSAVSGGGVLRILVVDDNVDTALSLAMLLELRGHRVETAHDGARAVEAARACRYDALLMDLGLPGVDGYEAARRIRALGGEPPPVLIAISGYGFDTDLARSREAGFDHHLVKPADLEAHRRLAAADQCTGARKAAGIDGLHEGAQEFRGNVLHGFIMRIINSNI